jgi:uncharacterized protein YndB with AHSA1/START domain
VIDVTQHINAVRRDVGSRTLEAGQATVVTLSRVYETTLEDLWDACTNPERIPRWFLPVTGELRLGGHYALEGNASGTIEACDPPSGFRATWEMFGEVSWIELRLAPEGAERARFTLEHIAHVDDERWAQYGPGAVGVGWDLGLLGLALHVAGSGERPPEADPEWAASEEGRRYMTESSERWREASVAAGTPEADAWAAAERTTAFYTEAPA